MQSKQIGKEFMRTTLTCLAIIAACATQLPLAAEPQSNAANQLWLLVDKLERAAPFTRRSVEAAIGIKLKGHSDSEGTRYSTDGDVIKGDLWMDSMTFRIDTRRKQKSTFVHMSFFRDLANPKVCISEMESDKYFGTEPDWVIDHTKGHAFPGIRKYYKRPWGEIVIDIPASAHGVSSQCVGDIGFFSPGLLSECWEEGKCREPLIVEN